MLIEFSVENFMSIKDRITLSMLASKDSSLESNVVTLDTFDKPLLRSAVIYGANASGKTNVLKAIEFMVKLVSNSHSMQKGHTIGVTPFKLDKSCLEKSTKFDVIFIHKGIRYAYGFSIDSAKVIEEYLYSYPKGRQKVIFERSNTNNYEFKSDIEEQKTLSSRTLENMLYISSATHWNYEPTSEAFEWFVTGVKPILSHDYHRLIEYTGEQILKDKEFKLRICNLIKHADLGINDTYTLIIDTTDPWAKFHVNNLYLETYTTHTGINKKGEVENVNFRIYEESAGTQKFFGLIGLLMDSIRNSSVLIVDELDARLHPILTKSLIEIFNNPSTNPNNAQLIFNTHDTNLLNFELFRRDQIWFTEKNSKGNTDLYSLLEYKPRKDENVEKGYLNGRYGAIPFIREEQIL